MKALERVRAKAWVSLDPSLKCQWWPLVLSSTLVTATLAMRSAWHRVSLSAVCGNARAAIREHGCMPCGVGLHVESVVCGERLAAGVLCAVLVTVCRWRRQRSPFP